MSTKPDHYELYEKIADMIDYCRDHGLPQTQHMLSMSMGILCKEETLNNCANQTNIRMFPANRVNGRSF